MFDWLFAPSCPCDPAAKAWVEERLQWLSEEFDEHAFNGGPLVLPTPDYFPDSYDGSKRSVRRLLDRVCEYMGVVPDLHLNARPDFKQGLRYLLKTADSAFKPAQT
jgi:hypothetical protein